MGVVLAVIPALACMVATMSSALLLAAGVISGSSAEPPCAEYICGDADHMEEAFIVSSSATLEGSDEEGSSRSDRQSSDSLSVIMEHYWMPACPGNTPDEGGTEGL